MAFFGKVYALNRSENFDEYVKSLNLPTGSAESYTNSPESHKLDKDGDEYVFTNIYENGPKEVRFKSGVEVDEKVGPSTVAKSTFTLDGNKLTHVQKFPDGNTITYVREYSADQVVLTITSNFWNGSAKRFYLA